MRGCVARSARTENLLASRWERRIDAMTQVYGRMAGVRVLCAAVVVSLVAGLAVAAGKPAKGPGGHPDLSGFWMQSNKVAADKTLMGRIAASTAVLPDTG